MNLKMGGGATDAGGRCCVRGIMNVGGRCYECRAREVLQLQPEVLRLQREVLRMQREAVEKLRM